MFIVKYRSIFYIFSGLLVVGSILAILVWGLNSSIDFKGGSLLEVSYPNGRPSQSIVIAAVTPLNLSASVIPSESNEYDIRTTTLTDAQKNSLISILSALEPASTSTMPIKIGSTTAMATISSPGMQVTGFNTIGPTLGSEAAWKSIVAVILVILAIVLFIAWAFRKVSEPVSSWKYGIVAIIDLVHNIMIPLGVFAVLGHLYGYEVDTLFVTALLVVLGFSVHDTIVVFDRIRENLRTMPGSKPFDEIVGTSINQTFVRSINTSLVVLFALAVLYFIGGAPTQHFSLALIVGIAAGTYASICLGSPLLVTLEKWQKNKGKK
jgi:preprotein translocase subunit SecF